MIGFVIGAFVGGAVGVTTMCMCAVAGSADRELETRKHNDPDAKYARDQERKYDEH